MGNILRGTAGTPKSETVPIHCVKAEEVDRGRGLCPFPEFCLKIVSENGEFWCILFGTFTVFIRDVLICSLLNFRKTSVCCVDLSARHCRLPTTRLSVSGLQVNEHLVLLKF